MSQAQIVSEINFELEPFARASFEVDEQSLGEI
jgi:hypothetical protein